jgi:lipid-A-disaccharide synthase
MKYYIVAGEASGDLHGSNLIKEIKNLDTEAQVRCWGGDLMEKAGGTVVKHYKELAFMGFIEVIKNLPTILKNLKTCKEDIQKFHPDLLILIDYPGFNLRIAKWAKEQGFKVIYYISPQVWAWKESRVNDIKKYVDKMLVILPFEKDFYTKWDYNVSYVGHPLVQVIEDFKKQNRELHQYEKPVIALLPGSRKQEIKIKLPVMLQASLSFPDHQFVVAKASSLPENVYEDVMKDFPHVKSVQNETYQLLSASVAALVTSGTATLETALFGVPQVVCYKGSAISYAIAKRLVKIKYISLVNLIMDKPVVKELIQNEMNAENVVKELKIILHDEENKKRLREDYSSLETLLKPGGDASAKAAKITVEFLRPTT